MTRVELGGTSGVSNTTLLKGTPQSVVVYELLDDGDVDTEKDSAAGDIDNETEDDNSGCGVTVVCVILRLPDCVVELVRVAEAEELFVVENVSDWVDELECDGECAETLGDRVGSVDVAVKLRDSDGLVNVTAALHDSVRLDEYEGDA